MKIRQRWHLLTLTALLAVGALIVVLVVIRLQKTVQTASSPSATRAPSIAAFLPDGPTSKKLSNDLRLVKFKNASVDTKLASRSFVMPPAGMPLKELVPTLLDEAAAGNKKAADRLHRDLLECNAYVINRLQAKGQLAATKKPADVPSDQIESTEKLLGELGDRLAANEALCAGVDEEYVRGKAFDVLLYAAQLGNEDAATCFVSDVLASTPYSNRDEYENLLRTYHANALNFVETGIRQGDWRMVNLMAMAYAGYGMSSLFKSLTPRNPVAAYAWLSLAREGANGADAQTLDGRLNSTLTQDSLSVAQVNRAETWAGNMFQQYFIDKPPFTHRAAGSTCGPVH